MFRSWPKKNGLKIRFVNANIVFSVCYVIDMET